MPTRSCLSLSLSSLCSCFAGGPACVCVVCSGGCSPSGGTSASCPTVAGMFSLVNDARMNAGLPPLGFLAPRLWQIAQLYGDEVFVDVTAGDTKTSCSGGFPAVKGWDPVTGWGQPNWTGILK